MARNLFRALVACVLLGAAPAFADSTIHGYSTNTTVPIPAASCIEVDQGPGTDTKACPVSVAGWAALFGFGPFPGMPFPGASFALGSNGSAFTALSPSGNTSQLVTQGAGSKIAGHSLVYDGSGNAIDGGAPGSGGTLTNLATTPPITGGPITTTGTLGLNIDSTLTVVAGQLHVVSGGVTFANPTATIGIAAVNGVATTAARSDSAPAIPACSSTTFGACKPDGTTITAAGGVLTAVSSGGGTQNVFAATFGGTGLHLTATATGFALNSGWGIQGVIAVTSSPGADLAVNGGAAKPIMFNTGVGLVAVGQGGIRNPTTTSLIYDGANFVMQSAPYSGPPITVSDTVDASKFSTCQSYVYNSAGKTLTLPAVATLPSGGCGVLLQTVGVAASLAVDPSDAINGGTAGVALAVPPDTTVNITSTAAHIVSAPLGSTVSRPEKSWLPGMNLAAADFPFFRVPPNGGVLNGIVCQLTAAVGGTATVQIWMAADGVAPTSGTRLDMISGTPAPCDANHATLTTQVMANAPVALTGNSWVYGHATGTWTSSLGAGGIQAFYTAGH